MKRGPGGSNQLMTRIPISEMKFSIQKVNEYLRRRRVAKWREDCRSLGIPVERYNDRDLFHMERVTRQRYMSEMDKVVRVSRLFGVSPRRIPFHVSLEITEIQNHAIRRKLEALGI